LPPRFSDAHARNLDCLAGCDGALGECGREPGADQLGHLRGGEAVGEA
jgi:hypothetical protein